MALTKRMQEVLQEMKRAQDADDLLDAEIVCDGGSCWLGCERISRRTVDGLLQYVAISLENMGSQTEHYTLNETGLMLIEHPERAEEVRKAILSGKSYDFPVMAGPEKSHN